MAKPIENNDNAKEFWENLADATELEPGTKTTLASLIGAATPESVAAQINDLAKTEEVGVTVPNEDNTVVFRNFQGTDKDKWELWNAGNNFAPTNGLHDVISGMGRNNWSHIINWNIYLDLDNLPNPVWRQHKSGFHSQAIELGQEGISLHCVKNLGADGNFNASPHMMWSLRPNQLQGNDPSVVGELTTLNANYPIFQSKVTELNLLTHYNFGEVTAGWVEAANPFKVFASDCIIGAARYQNAGAIAFRSWGDSTDSLSIVFDKARANSTNQTATLAGDTIGQLKFRGWDGVKWNDSTNLKVVADSTFSTTNAFARFEFWGGQRPDIKGRYATLGPDGLHIGGENDGSRYQTLALKNKQRTTNYTGISMPEKAYFEVTQASLTAGGAYIRGATDPGDQGVAALYLGISGVASGTALTSPINIIRGHRNIGGGMGALMADDIILSIQSSATERFSFNASGNMFATGKGDFATLNVSRWPTAADNAGAATAGVAVGEAYKTAGGELRWRTA